jgi:hypothetical protein
VLIHVINTSHSEDGNEDEGNKYLEEHDNGSNVHEICGTPLPHELK